MEFAAKKPAASPDDGAFDGARFGQRNDDGIADGQCALARFYQKA